jgi:aminopeptidase N
MEYPMLTCIGGPRDTLSLYSVTVHEIGHMWFPMQVGSDEKRFAWMDEGLTRFNQAQAMQAFFPGYDRERLSRQSYLNIAGTGREVELMRHGDLYPYGSPAYAVATYEKMAVNLMSLRALMGDSAFRAAYRDYGARWINRHPTPYDLWYAFERNANRDLDWFWSPWWFETWTLDQAIAEVRAAGERLEVVVEDRGLVPMPVHLRVTRSDGTAARVEVPVRVWLQGARRHVVPLDSASTVTMLEIDPELAFPDVDRSNNVWRRGTGGAPPP